MKQSNLLSIYDEIKHTEYETSMSGKKSIRNKLISL